MISPLASVDQAGNGVSYGEAGQQGNVSGIVTTPPPHSSAVILRNVPIVPIQFLFGVSEEDLL